MSQSILEELQLLLYSILFGIAIAVSYDVLRILRRVFPHRDYVVSIEDFLFWMIVAYRVFYVINLVSNGTFRFFCVAGAIGGGVLYLATISRLLVPLLARIFNLVLKPVRYLHEKWRKFKRGKRSRLKKKLTVLRKRLRMILCKQ